MFEILSKIECFWVKTVQIAEKVSLKMYFSKSDILDLADKSRSGTGLAGASARFYILATQNSKGYHPSNQKLLGFLEESKGEVFTNQIGWDSLGNPWWHLESKNVKLHFHTFQVVEY